MEAMPNEFSESEVPSESSAGKDTRGNWFALSVNVRHEKVVSELLRNKGFETFLPLYKRRHQYARREREFEVPLFPGYLFCHTTLLRRLPIMTTPGVIRIIGAGRTPIPVDYKEISSIKKALEAGVPMSPHHFWQSGEIGRVNSGPLAGVEGVVVKSKQSMRLILSVTLLQRAVMLEIDSNCVDLVTNGSAATGTRV
jgi:transcription antitermination factor NusG